MPAGTIKPIQILSSATYVKSSSSSSIYVAKTSKMKVLFQTIRIALMFTTSIFWL